jgi:hypothetical protein
MVDELMLWRAKKLSAQALSQQLPRRDMLATMPCSVSTGCFGAKGHTGGDLDFRLPLFRDPRVQEVLGNFQFPGHLAAGRLTHAPTALPPSCISSVHLGRVSSDNDILRFHHSPLLSWGVCKIGGVSGSCSQGLVMKASRNKRLSLSVPWTQPYLLYFSPSLRTVRSSWRKELFKRWLCTRTVPRNFSVQNRSNPVGDLDSSHITDHYVG